MADNVPITAGSGTSIATDDVGGVQYQRIKLVTSEDGSAEPVGDTDLGSTRALWVDNRPQTRRILATSAGLTTSTTAYTAGDQLGTILTIPNAVRANGGTGRITGALLLDKSDIIGAVDLYIYRASVTLASDNAAGPDVSDSDAELQVGYLQLPNAIDNGANRCASTHSISIPFDTDSGSTSLYVAMVTRSGHTFFGATTDLVLTLFIEQD